MKLKNMIQWIAVAAGILATIPVWAEDGKKIDLGEIVRVVGTPQPQFTVDLSPEDLKKLADTIGQLTHLAPKEIDINDLYNPGDEDAIAHASQALAKAILGSTAELVNLKAVIYRLAALATVPDFEGDEGALYQAYQTKIQASYTRAMSLLVEMSDGVSSAIEECKSELCVVTISNAELELLHFGNGLNQGLDLDQLSKFHFQFHFQDKLLQGITSAALANLWGSLNPDYGPVSAVNILVAGALTPLVAATGAVFDVGHAIAVLLTAPTVTHFGIRSRRLEETTDQEGEVHELVAKKIFSIVNNLPMEQVRMLPRKRHVIVLKCTGVTFHIAVPDVADLQCVSEDRGSSWNYQASISGLGLGFAFIFSPAFSPGEYTKSFLITLLSFIPINPEGTWFGTDVSGGAILGADLGVFIGKSGSVAVLTGLGGGGGAQISGSRLMITPSDNSQN